jgi:Rps23 Pro-64 3,4-dihydroxylase Tpa1-like proline 4-hydroxylase
MLYLGYQAEHWRKQYQGKEYVQVFLHYVKSRGENSWAVFDKLQKPPTDTLKKLPSITNNKITESKIIINQQDDKHIDVLKEYICIFDNIVSDELCDQILTEYHDQCGDWSSSSVGGGTIDRSIRNADVIGISHNVIMQKNSNVRQLIDKNLWECAAKSISLYNEKYPTASIVEDSGYDLLRYNTGYFYKEHTDSFKQQPRAVSCSFALNNDFEGGEFSFFGRKLKISLKKGSVIMFPSNFMYPHEILEVTKGTRYSIVTWFV